MKTRHTLIRLHRSTFENAQKVVNGVIGFMGNFTNKDFSCFVDKMEDGTYYDIVAICTDNEETIAHACAWGCNFGILME